MNCFFLFWRIARVNAVRLHPNLGLSAVERILFSIAMYVCTMEALTHNPNTRGGAYYLSDHTLRSAHRFNQLAMPSFLSTSPSSQHAAFDT